MVSCTYTAWAKVHMNAEMQGCLCLITVSPPFTWAFHFLWTILTMQPRSRAGSPHQGDDTNGSTKHHYSSSWTPPSSTPRRHLSPGKLSSPSSSATPASSTGLISPRPTHVHAMVRERSFPREEGNSRPPSIRSASSFGRPLNRLVHGAHSRRPSGYSNFSTMSETSLPWTTRDIGFNAISGKGGYVCVCVHM